MLYLRLQHIAPHAQHLQPVRMIEVVLEIELVEPQRRDEGGPVRGGVGRAEEGECEIWSVGGLAGGEWGGRREERGGREEWFGRGGGRTDRKICFWPRGGRKVFGGRGPSLRAEGGMVDGEWRVDLRDCMVR